MLFVCLSFYIYIYVGLRVQIVYWALGLAESMSSPRTNE